MHGGHMKHYVILKKGNVIVAVDLVTETSGDEIRSMQADGFEIVNESTSAQNSKEAIDKYTQSLKSSSGSNTHAIAYESRYKTAKFVSQLISIFGWLTFISGVGIALFGLASGNNYYGFDLWTAIALATPGFATIVSGLFLVATGQVMRATIDNADHTYQIFTHLKQN